MFVHQIKHYAKMFLLTLLLTPTYSMADGETHAVQTLFNLLDKFTSLQANFEQNNLNANTQQSSSVKGNMLLAKPNQFLWQTYDPLPQTIISNGETLWLYDPDLEQVTIQSINNNALQAPALLLSGDHQNIVDNFIISMIKQEDKSLKFILSPKSNDSLYSQIWLVFAQQKLRRMALVDAQTQGVDFYFSNLLLNPALVDSQFEFKIPPNTDIIESN